MTLPRKDARNIVVGDHTYRWAVSPDSGSMFLIVESAEHDGQRLEARFAYDDGQGTQRRIIRPGQVRAVIETALARGWQPAQRSGQAFILRDADPFNPPVAPST